MSILKPTMTTAEGEERRPPSFQSPAYFLLALFGLALLVWMTLMAMPSQMSRWAYVCQTLVNGVPPSPPAGYTGVWTYWTLTGKKAAEVNYQDGRKHGTVRWFDDRGEICREGQFDRGYMTGRWEATFPDGWKVVTHYKRGGVRVGERITYYPNGRRKQVTNYDQGEPHGIWEYYDQRGRLIASGHYEYGKPVGDWKTYSSNGEVVTSGRYVDGKRYSGVFGVIDTDPKDNLPNFSCLERPVRVGNVVDGKPMQRTGPEMEKSGNSIQVLKSDAADAREAQADEPEADDESE